MSDDAGHMAEEEPVRLAPNMPAIYRRKVDELTDMLSDNQNRDLAFDTIRGLIERVVLVPVDGDLQINLKGQIASILRLCSGERLTEAELTEHARQLVMVAGAGFEPATFRL